LNTTEIIYNKDPPILIYLKKSPFASIHCL